MRLSDAIKLVMAAKARKGHDYSVSLVCGCSALSLSTFLAAHLSLLSESRSFTIREAPYGDIVVSLQSAYGDPSDAIAVLLDYSSLDARLGLRLASSWTDETASDIVTNVRTRLELLRQTIAHNSNRRTVIHPPVLALPPIAGSGAWRMSKLETELQASFALFALEILAIPGVQLATAVPGAVKAERDVDGELTADFPYHQATASLICGALARVILPPVPIKGIITDLDDTLWRGILGEVGPENVHWNLNAKSQIHAVYQQLLAACASRGILVGVASKNNRDVVDAALNRSDILIKPAQIFPILAHWEPKSKSVAHIIKTWNIDPDAIIFIDDNQYELDEVRRAFPEIKTLRFIAENAGETYRLLCDLRDMCYRENVTSEDKIRLESIRLSVEVREHTADAASMEDFLRGLDAKLFFESIISASDKRPFELVNKTNQFNLNGRRYTEREWAEALSCSGAAILAISYADKFGELGRIGVMVGRRHNNDFYVNQWVLSCRAFSRRIEHAMLDFVVNFFRPERIHFDYVETPKNGPLRQMIGKYLADAASGRTASEIQAKLPPLYASISMNVVASESISKGNLAPMQEN